MSTFFFLNIFKGEILIRGSIDLQPRLVLVTGGPKLAILEFLGMLYSVKGDQKII